MASWARWALRPWRCAECRMSLTRCLCLGGGGVRGGTRAAAGRGADGSQSARLGEASSRWGATLSGRDRWRSSWGLRGGRQRVWGIAGEGVAGRVGASGSGAPEKPGEGWDGASFGGRWARGLIREQVRGSPEGVRRTAWGLGAGRGSRWVPGVGAGGWEAGREGHQQLTLPRGFPGPQALVAELHRRALVEYVRPLFRGRLRCGSARTRSRVAGRLREDAAQLERLFRRLVSAVRGRGGGSETRKTGNLGTR